MKRIVKIILIILLFQTTIFSQNVTEIDSLLNEIGKIDNSKDIALNKNSIKIIEYGDTIIPYLINYFSDSSKVNIYSECLNRKLTKGEMAIILTDRIELMPYYDLTGIENDIGSFCENNNNLIEYYLDAIQRDIDNFILKYSIWFESEERTEWSSMFETKKEKRKRKSRDRKKIN